MTSDSVKGQTVNTLRPLFLDDATISPADGIHDQGPRDIVSPGEYLVVLKCTVSLQIVICLGGMLANGLNVRTFLRMGLEDSVTIAFFNLAISDLLFLAGSFAMTVTLLCQILESDFRFSFKLNPYYVGALFVAFGRTFSYLTTLLTTFLAVQRCLCVAVPFHFKGMFTRLRTCVIVLTIWAFCLTCGGLHVSQFEIRKVAAGNGSSTFALILKSSWYSMSVFLNVVIGIVLNITCQFIVLVCVFVMARALRKSVQFRHMAANATSSAKPTTAKDPASKMEQGQGRENEASAKSATNGSPREKQAIIQVSLVCVIFLVTHIPFLVTAVAQLLVPELGPYKTYHYTFSSYYIVRMTIESINSAVNFLVYYRFNTKFKQLCFQRKNK